MQFVYAAWFRNRTAEPDDQDREWVACILVDADTEADARIWGDHLAKRYSATNEDEEFLRSEVQAKDDPMHKDVTDWSSTPVVSFGEEASDEKIGW